MKITIENTIKLAHDQARRFLGTGFEPKDTLLLTLGALDWGSYLTGTYTQRELAELNIALNPRGCHGRIAIALALAEINFPNDAKGIKFGEVIEDYFWQNLMDQWHYCYRFVVSSGGGLPETWIPELLMYEEPHGILVKDGMQHDPLFILPGVDLDARHPKVHELDPWSAIHCVTSVAHASLEGDLHKRLAMLLEASAMCPGMSTPIQNIVEIYFRLGMKDEARSCLEVLLKRRKTAGAFIMWEMITGEEHPDRRYVYDQLLWPLLTKAYDDMVAGMVEDEVCA